jgi:hypothetical protein
MLPEPHGVSDGHLQELLAFRRSRWTAEFARAGLRVLSIQKGPVASGYGFGFDRLRAFLEGMGLASEYIYIATKSDAVSRRAIYFTNPL